jgi:hypothetical protein
MIWRCGVHISTCLQRDAENEATCMRVGNTFVGVDPIFSPQVVRECSARRCADSPADMYTPCFTKGANP